MSDYRQQQECEEERLFVLLAALYRVAAGRSDIDDAQMLASELGISQQFLQKEKAA